MTEMNDSIKDLNFLYLFLSGGQSVFHVLSSQTKMVYDEDLMSGLLTAFHIFAKDVFKSEIREIRLKDQIIQMKFFPYINNVDTVFDFIITIGFNKPEDRSKAGEFRLNDATINHLIKQFDDLQLFANHRQMDAIEYDSIKERISKELLKNIMIH